MKVSKKPLLSCLKKTIKDKSDEITFYLEDDDGHQVSFNGESLILQSC